MSTALAVFLFMSGCLDGAPTAGPADNITAVVAGAVVEGALSEAEATVDPTGIEAGAVLDTPAGGPGAGELIALKRPPAVFLNHNGRHVIHGVGATNPDGYEVDNDDVTLQVRRIAPFEWELRLKPKTPLQDFWFPWEPDKDTLASGSPQDQVIYPYLSGAAIRSDRMQEFMWIAHDYPGPACSPLSIATSPTEARIVAAINWPTERVRVCSSLGRMALNYVQPVAAGREVRRRVLLARARGDEAKGIYAWHLLADLYRQWLRARLFESGTLPYTPPPAVQKAHGWLNIQLSDYQRFEPEVFLALWQQWGKRLPWMQFWSQMSNYGGPAHLASPPLTPGEKVGCCVAISSMHKRYAAGMPMIVQAVRSSGGLVGFYARPRDPYRPLDSDPDTDGYRAFFEQWMQRNQTEYGANASYLDVIGAADFGAPRRVEELIRKYAGPAVVVEFAHDTYPFPALIGGSLTGGDIKGGPGRSVREHGHVTFPQLARFIQGERIVFLGYSNGDYVYWGAGNQHWVERQAFLLGAKLDVNAPYEREFFKSPENAAVNEIIRLRDLVNWWEQDPIYRDTEGLHDVSAGLDVRVFDIRDGRKFLVIDNWAMAPGAVFYYRGQKVTPPAQRLSILIVQSPIGGA